MGTNWEFEDLERTLKDFEFTRKAIRNINSVVYSADFEEMDSATIFTYLYQNIEAVSFKDYLKRYIYAHAGIQERYTEVPEEVYREILAYSFDENGAPFSFGPTSKKRNAIIKGWLSQENVKRSTIFLLGFGLRMSRDDVTEFLTKVIREEDFNILDPEEAVFLYCFENGLRYAEAKAFLNQYEKFGDSDEVKPGELARIQEMIRDKKFEINTADDMQMYLKVLKKLQIHNNRENTAYQVFMSLVDRSRQIIADMYNEDIEETGGRRRTKDSITYGDIEKVICSGIPLTKNGNLQKMSYSVLKNHFRQKRMSRQRLDDVSAKKIRVDRFDIITLSFFICSQEQSELEPEIRLRNYLKDTNEVLDKCSMMRLYPVNPYEAFVLMCLLSESPLTTYSDIWEMSYTTGEENA